MKHNDLLRSAEEYGTQLENFTSYYKLPTSWFASGVDHLAIKAYNATDYESTIEQFRNFSSLISEREMQERRIAAAKLIGEFAVPLSVSFGRRLKVDWVEIMEARPEDRSGEPIRLDHAEVLVPTGIIPMRSVLHSRHLHPLDQKNDSHEWLSVIMRPSQMELKFTDKPLMEIVEADLATGRSVRI